MFYELVYTSEAHDQMRGRMLEEILAQARSLNTINKVTGLLIFNGKSFCQLIEGEEKTIEATFSRIQKDTRHSNISVFHKGNIRCRNFSEWAMSYQWVNNDFDQNGWMTWLEGQILINSTSEGESTGRRILRFVNSLGGF